MVTTTGGTQLALVTDSINGPLYDSHVLPLPTLDPALERERGALEAHACRRTPGRLTADQELLNSFVMTVTRMHSEWVEIRRELDNYHSGAAEIRRLQLVHRSKSVAAWNNRVTRNNEQSTLLDSISQDFRRVKDGSDTHHPLSRV